MPHVPNLNDFVNGLKMILNNDGILIIQFSAYLLKLIELNEKQLFKAKILFE